MNARTTKYLLIMAMPNIVARNLNWRGEIYDPTTVVEKP